MEVTGPVTGRPRNRKEQLTEAAAELLYHWVSALLDARPSLAHDDAELLCWAALSVFGSVADHHVTLPKRRFEGLLGRLACAVLSSNVPSSPPALAQSWQPPPATP